MINPIFFKVLTGFWVAAIAVLSLLPANIAVTSSFWDKFEHAGAFCVLSGLLCLSKLNWTDRILWCVSTAYGVFIEIAQSVSPGRYPDPMDALADAIGAAIGIGVVRLWQKNTSGEDTQNKRDKT